ncbi:MAG: SUMF1/EgtB/PvdO family nonheme iron enzyme [Planctomycetes bacterium]|nr:SUMF1/EgtB/PvdO family nonheme iron enzyme [Planctomycetota bacterium]
MAEQPDDPGDELEAAMAEALALDPPERAAAFARLRRARPDLAGELERRLAGLRRLDPSLAEHAEARDDAEEFPRELGDFELRQRLGGGGMGVVFLALQRSLQREVALKVIRPEHLFFPGARERFRREVEIVARLDHPGIVRVHVVGEAGGVPYFAMDRVAGASLQEVLDELRGTPPESLSGSDLRRAVEAVARRRFGDLPLPAEPPPLFAGTWIQACLRVAQRVAQALDHAHARGVLHRDVKPSNVLVTPAGEVLLVDFGLSSAQDASRLTRSGAALGSLPYMAPEQARGEREVDARSDVYSLGVTLYELLALHQPFLAANAELTRARVLAARPPPLRERCPALPWDVETVCHAALDPDPARRYPTAAAFARDLAHLLALEAIEARAPGPALRLRRFVQRHPTASTALALGLLALALGPAAGWIWSEQARRETERQRGELLRLADVRRVADLLAQEAELHPALPERVAALDDWLARSAALLERRELHAQTRARLERELAERDARPAGDATTAAPANALAAEPLELAWQADVLRGLDRALEELATLRPRVAERRDFAASVEERTVGGSAAQSAWRAAAAAVAADPRFDGLQLVPQLGLLPIGADPASGFQEFAHLQSGAPPERDRASGALQLGEASAIVLVLLPGGRVTVGSRSEDATHPRGSPHVDPYREFGTVDDEGPLQEVALDPWFVAKHEMTQGQWLRATGSNPSVYAAGKPARDGKAYDLTHPVEAVSWNDCERVLRQLGLALPTEAQWEQACRAGTASIWFTGDERASLRGAANVASQELKSSGFTSLDDWSDGYGGHAPIGRFAANGFGLHDTLGNVTEWCRDWYARYDVAPAAPGDGLREPERGARNLKVHRGGSFEHSSHWLCRCAARYPDAPDARSAGNGVRAARRLDGR